MTTKTLYSEALTDRICELVENGMPLSRVCKMEDMPTAHTVYAWLRKYPEFLEKYSVSKNTQLEMLAEEILEIADDTTEDRGNSTKVNRDRLRVDTRKFLLEKLRPDKFGVRSKTEITGDGGGPLAVAEVSEESLARYLAFLASKEKK